MSTHREPKAPRTRMQDASGFTACVSLWLPEECRRGLIQQRASIAAQELNVERERVVREWGLCSGRSRTAWQTHEGTSCMHMGRLTKNPQTLRMRPA